MRKILFTSAHALPETELGYDLGRSTSNNLGFDEILDDALVAELRAIGIGYGTTAGHDGLRAAIARRVGLHSEHVLTTNGAIGGLHLAVFCVCAPGDEVVTVTPGFPATFDLIGALGAVKRPLRLRFDEGYALDVERLAELLDERTRLVLLVSPHNPSGVNIGDGTLDAVVKLMGERSPEAYLLVDETFREATYGVHPPQASSAALSQRVLTVSSLSKAHGAPGLRLGWITCTAPALLEHLKVGKGKTAICCSTLDERVALAILERAEDLLKDRNARLATALGAVENWVEKNAACVEWLRPDAGGMCCVRLKPSVYHDGAVEDFYRLAAERQINMASGDRFLDERRVFRLGFGALPLAKFEQALEVLEDAIRKARPL